MTHQLPRDTYRASIPEFVSTQKDLNRYLVSERDPIYSRTNSDTTVYMSLPKPVMHTSYASETFQSRYDPSVSRSEQNISH